MLSVLHVHVFILIISLALLVKLIHILSLFKATLSLAGTLARTELTK